MNGGVSTYPKEDVFRGAYSTQSFNVRLMSIDPIQVRRWTSEISDALNPFYYLRDTRPAVSLKYDSTI